MRVDRADAVVARATLSRVDAAPLKRGTRWGLPRHLDRSPTMGSVGRRTS